ncbi:MAG: zinc-binding dehydrogenase [Chloroflexi bacterium]|nr:zinc-binding dehydrogenase [Chloroflexota bacterium]
MRAIRVHETGDQRRLAIEEAPAPVPRETQLLIRVKATSVNRADLGRGPAGDRGREGPFIPGLDVAGTIEAVGSQVQGWRVGDPVMALVSQGGYAELSPARLPLAHRPPEGMSAVEAASIPCVFLTAWYALTEAMHARPGETVVIHGAGSGVGTAGIQLARLLGARVITSAGSDVRVARGMELGAEAGVNYSRQDLASELMRLTGGRGVDVVLDSVGGQVFDATLRALAEGGRMVTIGGPAGPKSEPDPEELRRKGQVVQGMGVYGYVQADTEGRGWAQLNKWFEEGVLRPVVDRVLPWTQVETAHRLLRERKVFGKVVMTLEG